MNCDSGHPNASGELPVQSKSQNGVFRTTRKRDDRAVVFGSVIAKVIYRGVNTWIPKAPSSRYVGFGRPCIALISVAQITRVEEVSEVGFQVLKTRLGHIVFHCKMAATRIDHLCDTAITTTK
jgi:hypothetical protein